MGHCRGEVSPAGLKKVPLGARLESSSNQAQTGSNPVSGTNILSLPHQEAATEPNQREKPCGGNDHLDENGRTSRSPQRQKAEQ